MSLVLSSLAWFVFLMQLSCGLELMKELGKSSYGYLSPLLVCGLCVTPGTSQKMRPMDLLLAVIPGTLFVKLITES